MNISIPRLARYLVRLTAACIEAYSTGTRKLNMASGGGFVQSCAAAINSWFELQKDVLGHV